jgi:hypothetical protein
VGASDGVVDRAGDRRRQRNQDGLVALTANFQDAVAVHLAEISDVCAAGFEDPQPEQAQHRDQREVVTVCRVPRGRQQGLELQVPEAEGGRVGRHRSPAHVVGRRVRQELVDDAHPVEADHDRQPPGDGRLLVTADLL